jgi:hypothetical protein
MDIFILDKLLRPIDVVDEFVSMIWTERYSEAGDFELVTLSTTVNRNRFAHDTQLSIADSKRIMRIEKVEETIDPDNGPVLKIRGRELVSVLMQRTAVYRSTFTDEILPIWYMSGFSPAGSMRYMFWRVCVEGLLDSSDIIPFLQWGAGGIADAETLYPPNTIPEDTDVIIWGQKPDNLYNAIKGLGDIYDLGFRLYKHPEASKLYFNVYSGDDRTSSQTEVPPVIFSSDMENLMSTTDYTDSTAEYNVIQVVHIYKDELDNDITMSAVVSDPLMDPTAGGFDRKVKLLMVSTIPEEVDAEDWPDYLVQLGKEELMRSRPIGVFDGEIDQYGQYVYERDYFLGDLVEVRGNNGATAVMRVAEQIIVEDSQGRRSYPSLITKQFYNPGTWASWKYDVEWSAMGSGEYWANQ